MDHSQLQIIDLVIIAAYLLSMIFIGVICVKRVKNTGDYFVAGRSFGPLVLMATVCATIIGGSGLMGRAGVAYSSGFKAIMTAVPYLLGMLLFTVVDYAILNAYAEVLLLAKVLMDEFRSGKLGKFTLEMPEEE